jgi:hypothetical protein
MADPMIPTVSPTCLFFGGKQALGNQPTAYPTKTAFRPTAATNSDASALLDLCRLTMKTESVVTGTTHNERLRAINFGD